MRNFLIALMVFVLGGATSTHAQSTKAQLNTEITSTFVDNNVGAITPAGLRAVTSDIVNSIMPAAPVAAGNLACYNGTTGLLKDCGLSPGGVYVGLSGDCTATAFGVITCTKTNSAPFGTLAVQNANTVAITGGTITGMPLPTNNSDVATKVYVDTQPTSVFTGDNPPSSGTTGVVPAPPSGSTAANRILGAAATWVDRKPLYGFAVPTPFQTTSLMPFPQILAPVPISNLGTSGPGSTTMSITPSQLFQQITRFNGANSTYAYVDPVNGTDSGSTCPASAPCKTLQHCFTNCTPTNIVGISTGTFLPFSFDAGSSANLTHRLSFTGPATIALTGSPYIDPSAMTFTVNPGHAGVYSATLGLSGSQAVQRMTSALQYDVGTGNLTRLQKYASLAALQAASDASPSTVAGWFYSAGTLSVAFFGANVNTSKANLRAYYLDTNGNSHIALTGAVILLIDSPYEIMLDGVGMTYLNSSSTNWPLFLIEGRGLIRQFVPPGYGTRGQGGFGYFSGIDCQAPEFDCWNFDPPNAGSSMGFVVGHNLKGWYAGDTATFGTGVAPNRNGWSAHGGVNDILVASSFGQNFGPNIANTVEGTFINSSWLVGVETTDSAAPTQPGIGFIGNAGLPSAQRNAWVDTCATFQETSFSLYGALANITIKQTNCALNLPSSSVSGATISNYTRNAP